MNRRLAAMHPSLTLTYFGGTTWNPSAGTIASGWTQTSTNTGWYHETQIDLSGYAMDKLTFFPSAVGVQDPGIYRMLPKSDSANSGLVVLDIISSAPIDPSVVMNDSLLNNVGPAMFGSTEIFETLLYGLYRVFSENSTIKIPNFQQLQRSQRFESGEPTAADKLFCYRIVQIVADSSAFDPGLSYIAVPAARQLVGGRIGEENELVYMQRLRRSYELANQL